MARVLRSPTTWGEKSLLMPHIAAFEGDLVLLESIIYTEIGANIRDQEGTNALHHAAFGGHLDCVRFLLENGAVVDSVDKNGFSSLHIASFQGHLACVKALIAYGASVALTDDEGETALHKASIYDHSDIVEYLLKNKAFPDARNKNKKTALHITAQLGHEQCVKHIVAAEADLDLVDSEKRTSLHIAALYGHEKCVEHLLAGNANISLTDATGATALHNATSREFAEIVEHICNSNQIATAINIQDEMGITAMHHTSFFGNEACLNHLIHADGVKFDIPDNKRYTPLHLLALGGFLSCIQPLLEVATTSLGTDGRNDLVSLQSETGVTPLHLAALEGHTDCVKILLEDNSPIVDIVDKEGATALHKATFRGHEDSIVILLGAGCNVNATDKYEETPLHKAAYGGFDECIDHLLQAGGDKNAKDFEQAIPGHHAAATGQVSCLDKLIDENNVNAEDCKGRSPLHHAAIRGELEALSYLVALPNIDINMEDAKGCTPLYFGIENAYESIVHELIIEEAIVTERCRELVAQPRTLISNSTIDNYLEEKAQREKMKNLTDPKTRVIIRQLVALFNSSPKKGLKALIEKGVVGKTPPEIVKFLHNNEKLNKQSIGELLGEEEFQEIRKAFTDYMHFEGMDFEPALRLYLSTFRLPGEAQKIDRLMECFAERFYSQSKCIFFANCDACYILAFAVIMLNTDLHNPAIKKQDKMTKADFIKNNRGINDGGDVDKGYLESIYDNIQAEPFKMNAEDTEFTNAEKKGFLTKQGGRVKTWKKRWFVLTNNNLYYFRSSDDEKNPLGWIPLENLKVTMERGKGKQNRFVMVIQSSTPNAMIKSCKLVDGHPVPGSHSRFVIAATTQEEMQGWYDIIGKYTIANEDLKDIQTKLNGKR